MADLVMLLSVVVGLAGTYVCKALVQFFTRLDKELVAPFQPLLEDPDSLKPLPKPSIASEATKTLTVVIPAYNEEDRLPATLDEALGYLQRRRNKQGPAFTYEVIVVDDGSADATARVALDYARRNGTDAVRLLRLPHNRGKGMAVREGMLIARGQMCLFMDADGATQVSDLELLEKAIASKQCTSFGGKQVNSKGAAAPADAGGAIGMAVGSRAHLQSAALAKRSRLRNFLMHGFHALVTFVAGHEVRDTQCGFKLFTRRAAAAVFSNQRLQRWCFDVELVYVAQRLGVPISEVQVNWTEMAGSKIRLSSVVHMAFELATLKLCYQWLGLWRVYQETDLRGGGGGSKKAR
ncbi:dolichyl-phosphate beta-glucosyltransferase [Raphidocelis subcapitata]|uniref:dolichyl-phosphate beta-glucosyltransferase n=1 Tax=Raphidocelis subcapitata TaxID=307507 RepID=A0A2V0P7M7_9CHLO|nr:dolichyl-phosphate beta-glucosyltransferase [Raphidocelis subcapitata]|eukprot:GBF93095.1 dolichyl-phosphate beta-glucosyltransferase [Raphidocelis subcapitata]